MSEEQEEREFVEKLVALLKLSSPTTLNLLGCSEVSIVTRCLAIVFGLTGLENLNISMCHLDDVGLKYLCHLTGFINLDISLCNVSHAGSKHLSGLVDLDISPCNISVGHEHPRPMTGVIIYFDSVCKKEITEF